MEMGRILFILGNRSNRAEKMLSLILFNVVGAFQPSNLILINNHKQREKELGVVTSQ